MTRSPLFACLRSIGLPALRARSALLPLAAVGSLGLLAGLSAGLSGCTGDESPPAMEMEHMMPPPLEPPPVGQGVQFKMVSDIAPGQEIERCQFVVAPPEGLNINHDEVRYTPGSHHVLLYMTPYPSIPATDIRGKSHDTSGVFDCAQGAFADWQVSGVIAGAQSFSGGSMVALPPDVAVKVPAGTVMLMNTHYLNAGQKVLSAEARINVYTIPSDKVKQEGGVLFFYNPVISIPAGGSASARMTCQVSSDITLTNIQSHMHKRAVNYEAFLADKAGNREHLYTNTDWENVPVKTFTPAKAIAAGSALDYHCDYKNPEAHEVRQGASTKDEMCMLIGSYYPRDPSLENCPKPTWYGSGSKSCGVSLGCAVAALGTQDFENVLSCVSDSCESVGKPLTDALFCVLEQSGTGCRDKCQGPGGGECQACIAAACQPLTDACKAAACK